MAAKHDETMCEIWDMICRYFPNPPFAGRWDAFGDKFLIGPIAGKEVAVLTVTDIEDDMHKVDPFVVAQVAVALGWSETAILGIVDHAARQYLARPMPAGAGRHHPCTQDVLARVIATARERLEPRCPHGQLRVRCVPCGGAASGSLLQQAAADAFNHASGLCPHGHLPQNCTAVACRRSARDIVNANAKVARLAVDEWKGPFREQIGIPRNHHEIASDPDFAEVAIRHHCDAATMMAMSCSAGNIAKMLAYITKNPKFLRAPVDGEAALGTHLAVLQTIERQLLDVYQERRDGDEARLQRHTDRVGSYEPVREPDRPDTKPAGSRW